MQVDLLEIYNHFGEKSQLEKLKEEVNELIEAVENGSISHIHEEMADVEVMLGQIYAKYGVSKEAVEVIARHKINRTKERIKSKFYEAQNEKRNN